jgi:seryl-tRNA synthetase
MRQRQTTTDFQSAPLNIRVQRDNGTRELVHMLNGTAFAIGRMLIAIIENYQQPDGTIRIPDVLQPWMRGRQLLR